jgi:hypothetical protein
MKFKQDNGRCESYDSLEHSETSHFQSSISSDHEQTSHCRSEESSPSNSLHLENLQAERDRLEKKEEELKHIIGSEMQISASLKSEELVKRHQLAVQIEILQEDKDFLVEKGDLLGNKLWKLHEERIEGLAVICKERKT